MMRALVRNGGLIMTNYEVSYLLEENRVAREKSGGVVEEDRGAHRSPYAAGEYSREEIGIQVLQARVGHQRDHGGARPESLRDLKGGDDVRPS